VEEQNQGSALGVFSAFLDLALGITGPVAGWVSGLWGMQSIYLCAAIMVMVGWGLMLWVNTRSPSQQKKNTA
jgi:predicted MFS family arabinose efflux permease